MDKENTAVMSMLEVVAKAYEMDGTILVLAVMPDGGADGKMVGTAMAKGQAEDVLRMLPDQYPPLLSQMDHEDRISVLDHAMMYLSALRADELNNPGPVLTTE